MLACDEKCLTTAAEKTALGLAVRLAASDWADNWAALAAPADASQYDAGCAS
jgi:hypothetical protein